MIFQKPSMIFFFINVAKNLDSKLPPAMHDPLSYLNGNFENVMPNPHASFQDF